jgi:ABC-type cobalamin/Fe3+-siderophores transport system ATPase subunit
MLAISDASFGYIVDEQAKPILQGISKSVLAGQRIGILGANGQGKSTLVKTIARTMKPLAGNAPLVHAIQQHGQEVFGEPIPAMGTPLYTDVRLYVAQGVPGVIYGAGPRTVLESHAKRADERLVLEDLRRATRVIARTLHDLLT